MTNPNYILDIVKEWQEELAKDPPARAIMIQAEDLEAVAEALTIAVEALEKTCKFSGNMHCCRECHGDAGDYLAEKAREALSRIRSLPSA